MAQSRPPATVLSTPGEYNLPNLSVYFHHPAYPPQDDFLFSLYAWDCPDGGIYYAVAHNSCAIVAGNRFDGYFTQGEHRIETAMDSVLPPGKYFFHLPRKLTSNHML